MASIFGIPCDSPPPLGDVLFSTPLFPLQDFVKTIAQNPNPSMNKYEKFFYSKMFLILYLWYIVFRVPREMSLFLNRSIALNYSILLVLNVSFVFEMFRRYGYECTVFLVIILYLIYSALIYMIPVVADSPIGDALPELKELPVSTRKPGLNHCRRLAVCRATPVYDNYLFQKAKYEKCIECAKKNPSEKIIFKSSKKGCGSKEKDINAKDCYECTVNNKTDSDNDCTYSIKDCENVNMVLDILDPPQYTPKFEKVYDSNGVDTLTTRLVSSPSKAVFDRAEVCKEAHGSLCWFGKITEGKYRGWNYNSTNAENYQTYDVNDPRGKDQGFPTKQVCLHYMALANSQRPEDLPEGTCIKGMCEVSEREASCACSQYKDVAQYNNPCEFLEPNCDEKSMAYTEAQLKIKQADVAVSDIVTVGDAERFLKDLDSLANTLP
jgi:hypothetical protein